MTPLKTSAVARYAITVLGVAAAIGLTLVLRPVVDAEPVFFAAIILSSWFAGMAEGLLAVVLSALALRYYSGAANIEYLIVFVLSALLVSWLSAKRRRAEASLREARRVQKLAVIDAGRQSRCRFLSRVHLR